MELPVNKITIQGRGVTMYMALMELPVNKVPGRGSNYTWHLYLIILCFNTTTLGLSGAQ